MTAVEEEEWNQKLIGAFNSKRDLDDYELVDGNNDFELEMKHVFAGREYLRFRKKSYYTYPVRKQRE